MIKLLVLGLLDERELSGYDIQQKISHADAERWGGVLVGSIYHALKKLEQEKYIELASVEKTGHRQKSVYRITDYGKEYLQLLVVEALSKSSIIYPTTLYSGLSLLDKISPEEARQALKKQKELLDQEYQSLEQGDKGNKDQNISGISRITIANMFTIIQQQQRFVDEILEALDKQKNEDNK